MQEAERGQSDSCWTLLTPFTFFLSMSFRRQCQYRSPLCLLGFPVSSLLFPLASIPLAFTRYCRSLSFLLHPFRMTAIFSHCLSKVTEYAHPVSLLLVGGVLIIAFRQLLPGAFEASLCSFVKMSHLVTTIVQSPIVTSFCSLLSNH